MNTEYNQSPGRSLFIVTFKSFHLHRESPLTCMILGTPSARASIFGYSIASLVSTLYLWCLKL